MNVKIIEDIGNKADKHIIKHAYFRSRSIDVLRMPLPVGDYILCTEAVEDVIRRKEKRGIEIRKMDFMGSYKICIDTKKDMQEIAGNICGVQHERFRDEVLLAKNNGIRLYILVENLDGIRNIEDVSGWQNPRMKRYKTIAARHSEGKWMQIPLPKAPPVTGDRLAKAMKTMEEKYSCRFLFCRPDEAGAEIIELLGGSADESQF